MPQRELTALRLAPQHLQAVQTLLQQHVPHAEVWAYGSRVSGGMQECSDLDVVLRDPSDLKRDVDDWYALKEALQDSTVPILVDLHLWSRLPSAFHRNIERDYVVVQPGV
jgi:uncharacterized protein